LTGVVAGITLILLPEIDKLIANRRLQVVMLFMALGLLALCWTLAFRTVS